MTVAPLDNGKVKAVLYIDGEVVAQSEELTILPSDIAPSLCYIGRSMFKNDPMLKGRLDDFRIYNTALTAEQVKGIMEDIGEMSKDIKDSYEDIGSTAINTPTIDRNNNGKSDTPCLYDLLGRRVQKPAPNEIYINEKGKAIRK